MIINASIWWRYTKPSGAEEKQHTKTAEDGTWHVDTDLLWEVSLSGPSRSTPSIVDLYRYTHTSLPLSHTHAHSLIPPHTHTRLGTNV